MKIKRIITLFCAIILISGSISFTASAESEDPWDMLLEEGKYVREYLETNYADEFEYFHYDLIPYAGHHWTFALDTAADGTPTNPEDYSFALPMEQCCWLGVPQIYTGIHKDKFRPIDFNYYVTPDISEGGVELGTESEKLHMKGGSGELFECFPYLEDIKSKAIYEQADLDESVKITDVAIVAYQPLYGKFGIYVCYKLNDEVVLVASYIHAKDDSPIIFTLDDFKKIVREFFDSNYGLCIPSVNEYGKAALDGEIESEYTHFFTEDYKVNVSFKEEVITENDSETQSSIHSSEAIADESESLTAEQNTDYTVWIIGSTLVFVVILILAIICIKKRKET